MEKGFIEVPGTGVIQLPPLVVPPITAIPLQTLMSESAAVAPSLLLPELDQEIFDGKPLPLWAAYRLLLDYLHWGTAVQDWISQIEIELQFNLALRELLPPQVWPNPSRAVLVWLCEDKKFNSVDFQKAVGARLCYLRPPGLQFLTPFYLRRLPENLQTVFDSWVETSGKALPRLPPNRFNFEVWTSDDLAKVTR